MTGTTALPTDSPIPLRVWVARVVAYRDKVETFSSLPALFQGVCAFLKDAGTLAGVYPELAAVKTRILTTGRPLDLDDVLALADAHNARVGKADPLVLREPRVVLSVPANGERLAYHRELVQNLNLRPPEKALLTLNEECQVELLSILLQPRLFSTRDRLALLGWSFPQEGLNILRILDTLYKATFSRTIRKELCDPKIQVPLAEGSFHLMVDHHKTAHLTLPFHDLLKAYLYRLYRTPDLASVLDSDDRAKSRIQDSFRLLSGELHDDAVLPQKREEVAAILRDHRPSSDPEVLEEL